MNEEPRDSVTELNYFVIHKLNKERHSEPSIELRQSLNSVEPKSLAFINRLYEAYQHRSKKTYGIFSEESGLENFSSELFQFWGNHMSFENMQPYEKNKIEHKGDELVGKSFLGFSQKAMDIYKNRIASANLATGGYTLFALFSTKSTEYFMTLVLSEHQQFLIKQDMEIDDTEAINIKNIHLGCLVNLDKWSTHFSICLESYNPDKIEQHPAEGPYLSFICQAGKDVSEYFMKFIGAKDKTNAKNNAEKITNYINNFLNKKRLDEVEKRTRKSNLYHHIKPSLEKREEIPLKTISACISDPENSNEFIDYLSKNYEDHQISSNIVLDKNKMSRFGNVTIKRADGLNVSFDKNLIDKGVVTVDKKNNSITISEFSDKEIDEIAN